MTATPELLPETAQLVADFAQALHDKLLAAQVKYGYDKAEWRRDDWEDICRKNLMEHIAKGDPRDVAAYCAFMWHHGWSTKSRPEPPRITAEMARTLVKLLNMDFPDDLGGCSDEERQAIAALRSIAAQSPKAPPRTAVEEFEFNEPLHLKLQELKRATDPAERKRIVYECIELYAPMFARSPEQGGAVTLTESQRAAMKRAQDASVEVIDAGHESEPLGRCCYGGTKRKSDCASCAAWKPLKAEAQPVAWMWLEEDIECGEALRRRFSRLKPNHEPDAKPLYAAPPQPTGLSESIQRDAERWSYSRDLLVKHFGEDVAKIVTEQADDAVARARLAKEADRNG